MAYEFDRSEEFNQDLELIYNYLIETYQEYGEPLDTAIERAGQRITAIEDEMKAIAQMPYQGTLRSDLMDGIRNVTKNRVVYYFHIDENANLIRFLAVFFGGQDHIRHMLRRLSEG